MQRRAAHGFTMASLDAIDKRWTAPGLLLSLTMMHFSVVIDSVPYYGRYKWPSSDARGPNV
jgi:hypothetical protein